MSNRSASLLLWITFARILKSDSPRNLRKDSPGIDGVFGIVIVSMLGSITKSVSSVLQ